MEPSRPHQACCRFPLPLLTLTRCACMSCIVMDTATSKVRYCLGSKSLCFSGSASSAAPVLVETSVPLSGGPALAARSTTAAAVDTACTWCMSVNAWSSPNIFSYIVTTSLHIAITKFLVGNQETIFSCNIPVVLDKYECTGVVQSNTTNIIRCSSLLIRLHVSALSLGHHQVSDSNWRRLYSVFDISVTVHHIYK